MDINITSLSLLIPKFNNRTIVMELAGRGGQGAGRVDLRVG